MFGEQFYPTPKSVIEKMIEPYAVEMETRFGLEKFYKLADKTILEPSAGKGDILDFINEKCKRQKSKLYAIEIDPNLSEIIKGKGYRLISDNFLDYDEDYFFNLIILNPPFKNGVDHVLKAWEVVSDGGDVVALVNSETVLNETSAKRKHLNELINDFGSVEHLGDCFKDSERTTNVNVSLIRLTKPKEKSVFDFDFTPVDEDESFEINQESFSSELAINDVLGSLIRTYEKSKEAYINYIKAKKELEYYSQPIIPSGSNIFNVANESLKGCNSLEESYNNFNDEFKSLAWKKVLSVVGIEKYLTSSVAKNFKEFSNSQGSMAITKKNIRDLVLMLAQNSGNILDQSVVDVFDLFTKYHEENRAHVEGWKTNSQWKVNKKVILPNYVRFEFGKFGTSYTRYNEFEDVEKAMCYLSGVKYEDITHLREHISNYKSGKAESEFFYFRCFKKGTIHLTFKDESLWSRFNQKACEGKNWIGK